MRYRILLFGRHFRCGPQTAARHEDRVVAEAVLSRGFARDRALPAPLHDDLLAVRSHQRTRRYERSTAALIRHIGELREQQRGVGGVISVPPSPARRQHAGHPVQRIDRKPGIVRDAGQSGLLCALARLDERVVLKAGARLGHFLILGHVGERNQFDPGNP